MSKPNIEPDCTDREAGYQRSIAISLKRIADALHGDQFNTGIMRSMIDIAEQRRGH